MSALRLIARRPVQQLVGRRNMSVYTGLYNSVWRKSNMLYITYIVAGCVVLEGVYGFATDAIWETVNRGVSCDFLFISKTDKILFLSRIRAFFPYNSRSTRNIIHRNSTSTLTGRSSRARMMSKYRVMLTVHSVWLVLLFPSWDFVNVKKQRG
jgi:Ubiquinol-cytochrome C reductase, UQCRX/QCR9 like